MRTTSRLLLIILIAFGLAYGLGCGYKAPMTTPAQPGTAPTITSLSPTSATAGGPGFVLTVNGSNFAANAAVNWGGTALGTSFVTASQLTVTIPSSAVTTSSTVEISVTNPAVSGGIYGGGTAAATSSNADFTIH